MNSALTDRRTAWTGSFADDLREQFVITASDLIRSDPRVAVVLAEISAAQFRPVAHDHPDRVINVGIREQLMVSTGAGLALAGLRPIVHSFGAFVIERPWEQVKLDFSHQDLGGILVGAYGSYDWPAGGRTHQAPGDVALLDTLRDWTIHVPGHSAELDRQLRAAARGDDRIYLRVGDGQNPEPVGNADGRLAVVREGSRGTLVAVGPTLHKVLPAAEGLDVTVLYASTVRPFDHETLRRTLSEPNVIMVEPYLAGTSAAEIARALAGLPHRQLGLGVGDPDPHRYGEPADHDQLHGLDPAGLRSSIARFLDL